MNWKTVASVVTLACFLFFAGIALPEGTTSKQTQTLPLILLKLQDNQPNPATHHGWSLIHQGFGIVENAKGVVVLKGTNAKPLLNLQVSPDATKLLIHHGDGQDATYNVDGILIESLPTRGAVSASVIAWQWKDTTALIGVAEETADVAPNTYPEIDLRPKRTSLFLYRLGDKQQLTSLVLPLTPVGTIIRLEGVTAGGALVLSAVTPENYLGGHAEKALGVFDLGAAK